MLLSQILMKQIVITEPFWISGYKIYEEALEKINLQPLNERRDELCLNFAQKCLKSEKVKNIFPVNKKISWNGFNKHWKICCETCQYRKIKDVSNSLYAEIVKW